MTHIGDPRWVGRQPDGEYAIPSEALGRLADLPDFSIQIKGVYEPADPRDYWPTEEDTQDPTR